MAKATKRRRSSNGWKSNKLSIATIAGLLPGVTFAFDAPERSSRQILERFGWIYTGVVSWEPSLRWEASGFRYGLYPLLFGYGLHLIANWSGLNKMLRKVPMVQI